MRPKRVVAWAISAALLAPVSSAQENAIRGPLDGPSVTGAAFTAEAVTTVRRTAADGTEDVRSASTRLYRDGFGRVRVEQQRSCGAPSTAVRIGIQPDPEKPVVYVLNSDAHTAGFALKGMIGAAIGGGDTFALPQEGVGWHALVFNRGELLKAAGVTVTESPLGVRQLEGLAAEGRRLTYTVPAQTFQNDQPFQIIEDRWESRELKLLLYADSFSPQTGTIQYRLTNIQRSSPSPDLFQIPPEFNVVMPSKDGDTFFEYAEPVLASRPR